MDIAQALLDVALEFDDKRKVAEFLSDKSVTHSDHMKDWFFDDGSILRLHDDTFHKISINIARNSQ